MKADTGYLPAWSERPRPFYEDDPRMDFRRLERSVARIFRIDLRKLRENIHGLEPDPANRWSTLPVLLTRENEARHALNVYLNVKDRQGIREKIPVMSRWEHALTARYLGDCGSDDFRAEYLLTMKDLYPHRIDSGHPWQLWCHNMGRIALSLDRTEEAVKWFETALERCLSPGFGSTARVMALLPLSFLHALDRVPESESLRKTIRDAGRKLNPEYFSDLETDDFTGLLARIRRRPQDLFPFAFR